MAVPEQRDHEASRARLAAWLAGRLGCAGQVEVGEFRGPGATGFSNETLIFDARWRSDGRERTGCYAVRVAPSGYALFPDAVFETQHRALRLVDTHTAIPVPRVLWSESDPSVLGAPFFVMEEVAGRAPADNPPYHVGGWLHEVSPEQRAKVWWGAIDTIAELHRLDWRALDVGFLDRPELGAPGLDQQLAYYRGFLEWVEADEPVPAARRALEWLQAHRPAAEELVLCWGDARIGNILYDDAGERVAVLDWEMASLGAPAQDLGWALYMDRHHSEGCGVPRLPGFPSREETIARYEQRSGIAVRDLDFYVAFAALRFSVILARINVLFKQWGLRPADDTAPGENTSTRLTETILAELEAH
jgi:aminoglycoside phosphotransferase (APT) family kinase protein